MIANDNHPSTRDARALAARIAGLLARGAPILLLRPASRFVLRHRF
jgi:hypothetical protein